MRMFSVPASAPVVGTSLSPRTSMRWISRLRYQAYPTVAPTTARMMTATEPRIHLAFRCRPLFPRRVTLICSPRSSSPVSSNELGGGA